MRVNEVVNIDPFELQRLHAVENAWRAVTGVLLTENPSMFTGDGPGRKTGTECAVFEIKRLQDLAGLASRQAHVIRRYKAMVDNITALLDHVNQITHGTGG